MKNKNWIFLIILAIVMIAISTSISILIFNNKDVSSSIISNKALDELEYLDNTIISMLNSFNNIKTEEEIFFKKTSIKYDIGEENIDWKDLILKAEDIYDTWSIVTLDLISMNITNEDILTFNFNLDNLLISIKENNKINSEISLANLYSLLPKYINEISKDEEKFIINTIKSNIVSAYSIVETNKWNDVLDLLENAEKNITNLMDNSNEMSSVRKAKINKIYILLKELIKSSNQKNIDLFYFKYIKLFKAIDNI